LIILLLCSCNAGATYCSLNGWSRASRWTSKTNR